MITQIKTTRRKARRPHRDDIYQDVKEWALGGYYTEDCRNVATNQDKAIVDAYLSRDMPSVIKPGEIYNATFCAGEGTCFTFRMLSLIAPIVHKYKVGYED